MASSTGFRVMEKILDRGCTVLDVDSFTVFIARKFKDLRSSYGYLLGSKRYEGILLANSKVPKFVCHTYLL